MRKDLTSCVLLIAVVASMAAFRSVDVERESLYRFRLNPVDRAACAHQLQLLGIRYVVVDDGLLVERSKRHCALVKLAEKQLSLHPTGFASDEDWIESELELCLRQMDGVVDAYVRVNLEGGPGFAGWAPAGTYLLVKLDNERRLTSNQVRTVEWLVRSLVPGPAGERMRLTDTKYTPPEPPVRKV